MRIAFPFLFCAAALLTPLLPGSELQTAFWRGYPVTYQVVNGVRLMEGDIVLESTSPTPEGSLRRAREAAGRHAGTQGYSVPYSSNRWPQVGGVYQVPYTIANTTAAPVAAAITQFNATFPGFLQFVARSSETDYVEFNLDSTDTSGTCHSSIGRIGGMQQIGGSASCLQSGLMHEMGHTIGLYHEHSRPDRDSFVKVLYANVPKADASNFYPVVRSQPVGPYDYRSLMHYFSTAFSKNGQPTLQSIPAGIPLTNPDGYSEGDIDTIQRLYGAAPASVTITTNPPGLLAVVDGATVTTPRTFAFAMGSSHTLSVPPNAQTQSGFNYVYGRWNDVSTASHTIVIAPGDGSDAAPASQPAITVYSANFIQLLPFSPSIQPPGAGTVTAAPPAQSFAGLPGVYYPNETEVTLTGVPNPPFQFYRWSGVVPPLSQNPKTSITGAAVTAYFSVGPITTLTTNPEAQLIQVDGHGFHGPINFAPDWDATWGANTSHTVTLASPQLWTGNGGRFTFSGWSDGGPQSHSVMAGSVNTVLTATFDSAYAVTLRSTGSCAGQVSIQPTSADGFYADGAQVTVTEQPGPGYTFTGWTHDLTGLETSRALTIHNETLVIGNYNLVSEPFSVSGFSPYWIQPGAPISLTVNGSGFTQTSTLILNGVALNTSYLGEGQLMATLAAGMVVPPSSSPVQVLNSAPDGLCALGYTKPWVYTSGESTVKLTGIASAASYAKDAFAPGEIVAIFGANMGPSQVAFGARNGAGLLDIQAGGSSVTVNGVPAPILYSSAGQIAAIIPYATLAGTATLQVSYLGEHSETLAVPIAPAATGLFTADASGAGQAAAINLDGTVNGSGHPIAAGSYISLYGTGEGLTLPAGQDATTIGLPLPSPVLAVSATVGGLPAVVQYAGGAPGDVAGVFQINIQIPTGVSAGSAVPVQVQVGSASTQGGVTIAVAKP